MRLKTAALTAALLASSLAFSPNSIAQTATTNAAGLSPSAVKQLQEIYSFKASLTPAERKMSLNLAMLSRLVQGKLPAGMVQFVNLPARNTQGKFTVEVQGRPGSALTARDLGDVETEAAPVYAQRPRGPHGTAEGCRADGRTVHCGALAGTHQCGISHVAGLCGASGKFGGFQWHHRCWYQGGRAV